MKSGDELTGNFAPDTVGHGTHVAGIVVGKGPEIITKQGYRKGNLLKNKK